jgi:hypothetical protein
VTHILLIKLLLTPLFIAALTLIGRRWGPAASGAVAGLPLTSGPVSLFLALEQGTPFAAHAAIATLAGLIAVGAFCLAYSFTALRRNWIASAFAGAAAFFAFASLLLLMPFHLAPTVIIVVAFLVAALRVMPRPVADRSAVALMQPKWDLPLRAGIATGLVFLLTAVAPTLGPQMTGLVSPFPVFGGVLAIFAHRQLGASDAQRVLRSVVRASLSFAVFFLIVGAMLVPYGCAVTYSLAAVAALSANTILFLGLRRKS